MMRFAASFRILGLLLMIFSLSMLPPMVVYLYYRDGGIESFLATFILTLITGLILWFPFRKTHRDLKIRDGFLVVVLFWTVLSTFGAFPFYLHFYPGMSFTNSLFESVSGMTTTGASVLSNLDYMPHSILYYRQQLTLLGGMGIIVLALAILPLLGIGGMQLYLAEISGPIKTTKLRPRLTQTAKVLWYIYAGLVACCALSYWLAGMHPFEALGESFSTVSTGGFSVHDDNFAYYHSHLIEGIGILFMLLGAINFGLHFQFIQDRKFSVYTQDPEFKTYIKILCLVAIITLISLVVMRGYTNFFNTLMQTLFAVTTVGTTTGFITANFDEWPSFLPYMLMFLALIGGCGGSTSGGIKVLRFLLLKEQSRRELRRLIHPNAVFSIRLGQQSLPEHVVQAIWGFVAIFIALFIILLLALLGVGLDIRTAFGSLAGCLSNTGIGLGKTGVSFADINDVSKWILTFAMIAGRLEIFSILVLFAPSYWRK